MQLNITINSPPELITFLSTNDAKQVAEELVQFGWTCRQNIDQVNYYNKYQVEIDQYKAKQAQLETEIVKLQKVNGEYADKFLQAQNAAQTSLLKRQAEIGTVFNHKLQEDLSKMSRIIEDQNRSIAQLSREKDSQVAENIRAEIVRLGEIAVAQLQNENKYLHEQLNAKRHLNTFKGQVGEELIASILRDQFHEYEIVNVGKSAKHGDLHLINSRQEFVVVEVKNKATVTALDVRKVGEDIAKLQALNSSKKFAGYLFVSIGSKNIPKKGSFCFENIDNVPVIWCGFDEELELEIQLPQFAKMLFFYHSNFDKSGAINLDVLRATCAKFNALSVKVKNMLVPIDALKGQVLNVVDELGVIWSELTQVTKC